MRVLHVSGEFPPLQGGVGDYTNQLAQVLAGLGIEVTVLTTATRRVENSTSPASAVRVFRHVHNWNWGALESLRNALKITRADILHIQYQTAAFRMHPAINLAPRLLGTFPLMPSPRGRGGWGALNVVTFHDLKIPYLFPKAGPVRQAITFELARAADAVIATNDEDAEVLRKKVGAAVRYIPIGSNITPAPPPGYDRETWRARLGIGPDDILLSYFGFLNESKGAEDLIRALSELNTKGINAKLIMVGGQVGASDPTNVKYLARVKSLASELGMRSRVIWTDYVPQAEVSAHLLASDICVLPYRDGVSLRRGSFMAALAHGLPILTTLPRQQASGLRDRENIFLLPAQNPHALAQAIIQLARNPELRIRLGRGARELAQSFTWDKIAAQHLELYRSLLDE